MKRRFSSMLLAILLVLSLSSTTVLAADDDNSSDGDNMMISTIADVAGLLNTDKGGVLNEIIQRDLIEGAQAAGTVLGETSKLKGSNIEKVGDYYVVSQFYVSDPATTSLHAASKKKTTSSMGVVTWHKNGARKWSYKMTLESTFQYDGKTVICTFQRAETVDQKGKIKDAIYSFNKFFDVYCYSTVDITVPNPYLYSRLLTTCDVDGNADGLTVSRDYTP